MKTSKKIQKQQTNFDNFKRSLKAMCRESIELLLKDLFRQDHKTRKEAWEWFNDRTDKAFSYRFCLLHSELNPNGFKVFFQEYDSFMKLYSKNKEKGLTQFAILKKRYNEPEKNKKSKKKN